ncbi:hypothetical protein [Bacteroides sp.]|uniref:hypothetical protein n=1 Tax=Bacteroides sp. TaxID=29523 RepID=UPI0025C30ADF|nr:hypothetical protein [Bacteroides sp.]
MTQHNVFIRRFGNKAILITVTDWEDFKELEAKSTEEYPDFIVGAVTTKNAATNMLPTITVNTHAAEDITQNTKGASLQAILLGTAPAGPLWAHKKVTNPILELYGER